MGLSFIRRKTPAMVGVDFGSDSVKALALSKNGQGFTVQDAVDIATPKGVIVDHQLQDIEAIGNTVKQLRRHFSSQYKFAAGAVSGTNVITKIVFMDANLSGQELETQIEIEAEHLIPFPMDEISIDFEILGRSDTEPSKNNVLLSAARNESVIALASCLEEGKFMPKVIDVASHALARGHLLFLRQQAISTDDKVVAAVDVGANMTTFAMLYKGEAIYARVQNFGGEHYTQGIAGYYNLSRDEAEKAKLAGELPADYDLDVLAPFITSCLQQIRRNLQLFNSSGTYADIGMLSLSGGCAAIPELATQLESDLQMPVCVANPFGEFAYSERVDADKMKREGFKFVTALGLALRSF